MDIGHDNYCRVQCPYFYDLKSLVTCQRIKLRRIAHYVNLYSPQWAAQNSKSQKQQSE